MQILDILTKRKQERNEGYDQALPTITQIRGLKRRTIPHNEDLEYEQVVELLNKLAISFNNIEVEETKAFSYGVKLGDGSDHDPFVACFSSNSGTHSQHLSVRMFVVDTAVVVFHWFRHVSLWLRLHEAICCL